jgi:hypothetical protein
MVWGVALVVVGAAILLQRFGVLGNGADVFWSLFFLAGSVAFLWLYRSDNRQWWALIPASVLLGLALIIGLDAVWPSLDDRWTGFIFLALMALGFLAVYVVRRENWWALIPGGVLTTTAVVALISDSAPGAVPGAVMMLGLAATFGLVSLVETPAGRLRWALIPAGIMAAIGLLLLLQAAEWANVLVAVIMIGAGIFAVVSGGKRRRE